ncbi:MAG: SET domain-containing protein-lysine N-methyltransferase [Candidatus Omnitrophica bacterium]|nr:SET domain-containing protein-lysine N-methyltransferase [Candidatus Omnitrophota bacterium]
MPVKSRLSRPRLATSPRLTETRKSTIHGLGLFACSNYLPNARVIEYVGVEIDKQESSRRCQAGNDCIFHLDGQRDIDGNVEWNPARFINHSCAPNCEAELIDGRIWIIAKRLIRAGEEITFNYGYDLDDYQDYPCRCGSPAPLGYMVASELSDYLRIKLQTSTPY